MSSRTGRSAGGSPSGPAIASSTASIVGRHDRDVEQAVVEIGDGGVELRDQAVLEHGLQLGAEPVGGRERRRRAAGLGPRGAGGGGLAHGAAPAGSGTPAAGHAGVPRGVGGGCGRGPRVGGGDAPVPGAIGGGGGGGSGFGLGAGSGAGAGAGSRQRLLAGLDEVAVLAPGPG